jgi:hypothetical protein
MSRHSVTKDGATLYASDSIAHKNHGGGASEPSIIHNNVCLYLTQGSIDHPCDI